MASKTKARIVSAGITKPFAPKSGYTAVVGDKVKISADFEVDAVAAATDVYVGEVLHIEAGADNAAQVLTVELRGDKVDVLIANGAGVSAGDLIKLNSKDGGIPFVSVAFGNATTGDPAEILYAIALEAALDTATFACLVL